MNWWELLFPLLGYLCGSIPFAYIITRRVAGIDIRTRGSGSVGATNTLRVLGPKMGLLVLLLDMVKVLAILWIGQSLSLPRENLLFTAAAAVIGHNWPVFLGFRGGKGVAVSTALLFYFYPLPGLVSLGVFGVTVVCSRFVSLGSLLAALSAPLLLYLWNYSPLDVVYTAFLATMLVIQHRANIVRLLNGSENKVGLHKKT